MSDKHEVVTMCPTHVEAEAAVLELQKAGFDMRKIRFRSLGKTTKLQSISVAS